MSNQPAVSAEDDRLPLRGYRGSVDFETVARIRNDAARQHEGDRMTPVGASVIESLLSSPERFSIAQVGQESAGYVFVARAGGPQLDEFGTVEGKSWLFIGPTCAPEWQGMGIEGRLLAWLVARARESGIPKLLKFARIGGPDELLTDALAAEGFRQVLRYYQMHRELGAPPPPPRGLPAALDLIDFRGEEDLDVLWSVLEPAFGYLERDSSSYAQNRATFGSLTSAYFPICLESASGKPVGTIALVQSGSRGHIATFGVIPSFQGRGIGSLLMERAIDRAWRLGIRSIDLSVRAENPRAIGLYGRFGFEIIPGGTTTVLQREISQGKSCSDRRIGPALGRT